MNIRKAKKRAKKALKELGLKIDLTYVYTAVIRCYTNKTKVRFFAPYAGRADLYRGSKEIHDSFKKNKKGLFLKKRY